MPQKTHIEGMPMCIDVELLKGVEGEHIVYPNTNTPALTDAEVLELNKLLEDGIQS